MPRPRKNAAAGGGSSLTPGQAAYVLDRLVRERRISQTEVNRYVGEMGREISELEQRLARLRDAAGPAAAAAAGFAAGMIARRGRRPGRPPKAAATATAAAPSKKRGRRKAITPEQLASRQLQGRYLALVRRFAVTRRAQFARTAKEKGREAAIKEMQDALKK